MQDDNNIPQDILSVVREDQNLRKEMTRLAEHIKTLREKRRKFDDIIYNYMVKHNLKKIQDIKISFVKPKTKRKTLKEKKKDAFNLFYQNGIEDPSSFWNDFKQTQKYIENKESKEYEYYLE